MTLSHGCGRVKQPPLRLEVSETLSHVSIDAKDVSELYSYYTQQSNVNSQDRAEEEHTSLSIVRVVVIFSPPPTRLQR